MVKKILFIFVLLLSFGNCKSSKKAKNKKNYSSKVSAKTIKSEDSDRVYNSIEESRTSLANDIVKFAKQFKGVRYKWGGTTKAGMDCSGLVFTAFKHQNVLLPRISRDMAKRGKRINLNEVTEGDLLFFKTNKRQAKINHVGLVVSTNKKNIEFIHSTTSKGVITSLLSENYWNKAFIEARRVL